MLTTEKECLIETAAVVSSIITYVSTITSVQICDIIYRLPILICRMPRTFRICLVTINTKYVNKNKRSIKYNVQCMGFALS